MQYKSKQTSYELAHEIAQKAKKILGLSQYDVETLEHDINNLRAHEWIDIFNMMPDSNEVKKLYFTHCVELNNDNEQELEENMERNKKLVEYYDEYGNWIPDVKEPKAIKGSDFEDFTDYYMTKYNFECRCKYSVYKDKGSYVLVDYLAQEEMDEEDAIYLANLVNKWMVANGFAGRDIKVHADRRDSAPPIIVFFVASRTTKVTEDNIRYYWAVRAESQDEDYSYPDDYDEALSDAEDLARNFDLRVNHGGENVIIFKSKDEDYWEEYNWVEIEPVDYLAIAKKIITIPSGNNSITYNDVAEWLEDFLQNCSFYDDDESEDTLVSTYKDWIDDFIDDLDSEDGEWVRANSNLMESLNKTYQITVKYHNEPKERIEARSAKDRKDLEYQLNMDDEVEWYDFDEKQFNEDYSTSGYSWDEVNGMIHIYEDGKLIDKYPDMESAEEAGWDLNELNESYSNEDENTYLLIYNDSGDDFQAYEDPTEEFKSLEDAKKRVESNYDWDYKYAQIRDFKGTVSLIYMRGEGLIDEWYDLNNMNESLDQMREKALKMKETSNAFAILYGYRTKDGKEVELEPEEFATEKDYRDRIQQITNSFTKLSDKDPRGNRYGKESGIEFYVIYPNKMPMNEDYGKKAFTAIVKKDGKIAWAYDADDKKYAIMAAQSYLKKLQGSDACVLDNSKGVSVWNSNEGEKENPKSNAFGGSANTNSETTSNGNATLNTDGAVEKIKFIATEIFNGLGKKYSVDIVDGYKVHIIGESKDLTNSINNIKNIASNGLEAVAEKMPDGTYSYKFQKKGAIMIKESNDSLKWNMGSDKSRLSQEEIDLLDELAQKLEVNSPNGYKYVVQSTYEDYGAGMKWWNIVCYDKKGNSWQVLNTKEWLDLMNTGDVDKVYQDVINGDYFQDKQKDINEMNMGELFNHMED